MLSATHRDFLRCRRQQGFPFLRLMKESTARTDGADDIYISKLEMARRMDVSTRTIEVWMRQNKVPFEKIGRTVRFHWGDVRTYLSRQNRIAAQPKAPLQPAEGTSSRLQELAAAIRNQHRGGGIPSIDLIGI
jgi:excisionase family DNA binding protein